MARKMADEILEAERGAERIISDAEKRASEISESAKLNAEEKAAGIIKEAQENAEKAIASAKAEADAEKQEAVNRAEDIERELDNQYEQNIKRAVDEATDILFS